MNLWKIKSIILIWLSKREVTLLLKKHKAYPSYTKSHDFVFFEPEKIQKNSTIFHIILS